jgi:hypothetical protein
MYPEYTPKATKVIKLKKTETNAEPTPNIHGANGTRLARKLAPPCVKASFTILFLL